MKKILLIEDDKFLVKIYENAMTKQGYEVKVLENGSGAQELIKSFKPDLVILDLVMPVVDGFETLTRIRQDEQIKNQAVFVLTALETQLDVDRIKTLGVEKYFIKSNKNFKEIIEEVNNYLNQ